MGTRCDLSGYTARRVRFILAHREAFNAAYLDPNRSAASNELERLSREYITLPPRHDCSCRCPNEQRGWPRCMECARLDTQRPKGPAVGVAIGRTSPVNAPMPSTLMLDLERALAVLGNDSGAHEIARYMSLNGTSVAAHADVDQPRESAVAVEREVLCLLCSRPAAVGQQQCQWCGGSLVVTTVA